MSALTDYEKNELSLGRRYRQYEGAYNAAFAADPNPNQRKYNELAPKDDIQWKRLEVYRGNDKNAYHAHLSNPADPLARPTDKEQAMWQANQKDQWRVEREPGFSAHPQSNNKWLPMSPEQRGSEKATAFFEQVEAKHGPGYAAYAAKAGSQAVAKDDYLRTMAVLEVEGMRSQAQQQQRAPQAPAQTQANPAAFQQATPAQASAQQAPQQATAQQATPAQASAQQAPQQATAQQAPAQNAQPKTRLSLANFQGPTSEYVEQRGAEIAKATGSERAQIKQQAEAKVGDVQARLKDADSYVRVQSSLAQLREARALDSQSQAQSQAQTRNRSRSQ